MPTRTYQVNYDITANTIEAVSNFEKLVPPIANVAAQARAAQEAMSQIMEMSRAFKTQFSNFNIKPTIDLNSFKTSLASMEQNVKESAIRIRAAIESSLGGTRKAFEQNTGLLGTNNWKKAEATETKLLKSRQQRLEALQKLYRKLSIENMRGSSRTKNLGELGEINKWFDQMKDSKPVERVQKLLRENGIGNIIQKNSKGRLITTDMSKLRDFTNAYAAQVKEFAQQQEKAVKANMSRTPGLLGQLGKNNGSFVSGLLGATPEEINNLKAAMSSINGLMSGVQQTQQKVQNVVKKTAIPQPVRPANLPTVKEMRKLREQISAPATNAVFGREKEIRSWERLEKAGKIDDIAGGRKTLEYLRSQRAIWQASQQRLNDPDLEAKKAQYAAFQKQRSAYAKQLREWRAKPYTETTEQIVASASNAQAATAKPIKFNIVGNFAKQIKPLLAVSRAISSIPKEASSQVNITVTDGVASKLNTIKESLIGINRARTALNKGSYKGFNKIVSSSDKANAAFSGTSNIKAGLDRRALGGDLRNSITNLQRLASDKGLMIKPMLDRTTIGRDLQSMLSNLQNLINERRLRIKPLLDRTSVGRDLQASVSNLNKVLSREKKSPTIKVVLDTSEAQAKLNTLIEKIKASSPQTIKIVASGNAPKASVAPLNVSAPVASSAAPTTNVNRRVGTSNMANIAASTAAMRTFMPSSKPGIVDRLRKSMYPLTGNVSLGASTPVALDMAKGMGIMYGVGGAMNLVTGGLHDAMEYQNTMETAEEILKKNYAGKDFQKDFNEMTKEVRRVAKQTKFTAPQAADATRFMAMAGLSIPMIKYSVSPIADVAVIGDNDFGEVADKMTNIQTAFQIQPNRMRHVADAITNTFSRTNTDMMMLAESMQYAAPMAHLSGMSLDDTLAMIGIMGNSGIQASMAGTTLRMMLQNTLNPNKKQTALWKKLGVHTRDKSGNLRNMIDILADVKESSIAKKIPMADVVSNLFRVTASAGAGALINNIDSVKKLAAQNASVGNISSEISARKQNTVKGLWAQMTSSFTEANLKVFEQFQEDIKGMINAVKDYFNSKEAVENLIQAFDMIRSLMNMFGTIAKGWLWVYNKFGGIVKAVVWTQMFVAQIGLMTKPIMSLINVFGGLKSMAVGFVSALSGVGGLKKAAVAASVAGAITGNANASTAATAAASNYVSRHTALSPLSPSAQTAAYLSAYTPYSVYSSKMNELSKKRMFYVMKGNRLKNAVQMQGSLAREAVNPFLFASMGAFNPANKEDVKHLNEMMKNRNKMSMIYAAHPYQRSAMQRAYAKVRSIDSEMATLRMDNVIRNKKLSQARTYDQLSNIGLLRRYNRMNPNADNIATQRYQEYLRMRREEQIANIALMSRFRYSRFYEPGKNTAIDTYFANRRKTLALSSSARRAGQIKNLELMYRASRLNGKGLAAMKYSFKNGAANALTFGSMAGSLKGFWISIRSGFISVISGIAKGFGMLMGPVGLFAAAIGAAGVAAWGLYKIWKKQKEDQAKNIANSKEIKKQAANFMNGYKNNVASVESGVKVYTPTGRILKNIAENGQVFGSKRTNAVSNFVKNFSAINAITDTMSDPAKAKTIFEQYVKPNFELMGGNGSYAGKVLSMSFNQNLEKQMVQQSAHRVAMSGGFAPGAKIQNAPIDLSYVKKAAAVSQLYRVGASSKEAMDARKKIFDIYKNSKNINEARKKSFALINSLFGANSIQAIGEKDANFSSYNDIVNSNNISGYKQYRLGAYNSLMNWINDPKNSKLAYFDGMLKLRQKLTPYTTKWYEAMSSIMSNMQLMFQDTKGKIHNLNLTFDKNGTPLWNDLYSQFRKLHIDFGNSFKNHVQILGNIAAQMGNIPELSSYIQQIGGIREFLILQIRKLQDFKDSLSWDKFEKNTPQFTGTGIFNGDLSLSAWKKYTKEFYKTHHSMEVPLSYREWKRQEKKRLSSSSPFLDDLSKRKQAAKAADEQIEQNETLNKLNKIEKATNKFVSGNNGAGGGYTSPIADAAKETNNGLRGNRYGGATARPTQINIRIDKLANFDKVQFLEGKDRDIMNAIANATAEAVSNLVPMLNSLVTNDRRADMI